VSAQVGREPSVDQVIAAVEMLKLLADPTRLRIVWSLLHGEHSVNELADHVGAQPSAVSQHLAKLRLARLVRTRRDGNRVYYLVKNDHVERLVEQAVFHLDHVTASKMGGHRRTRQASSGRTA